MAQRTVVIMEGDDTGQEPLLEGLHLMDQGVTRFPLEFEHYHLSVQHRRAT